MKRCTECARFENSKSGLKCINAIDDYTTAPKVNKYNYKNIETEGSSVYAYN